MFRHAALLFSGLVALVPNFSNASAAPHASGGLSASLARTALPFIANAGQHDPGVRFHAQTFAGALFVTKDGALVHVFNPPRATARAATGRTSQAPAALRETFVGGRARPEGIARSTTNVSFLVGEPSRHRSHVEAYEAVDLGEVFPGVEVTLRAHGRNVEKIYTIAPGSDPARIVMAFEGARATRTDPAGALVVRTDSGDVAFTPPIAWQDLDGGRVPVDVAYALDASGTRYGFRVGRYDTTRPLVIDPLLQSTYLGGSEYDALRSILVHPTSGEVYVMGDTLSTNLSCTTTGTPNCQNGVQEVSPPGRDCFVARLNATLTTLIQATYLGGNDEDSCTNMAFSPDGASVYISGSTKSTNALGPGVKTTYTGAKSAFVARIVKELTGLQNYTYYGNNGFVEGTALAIHAGTGDVYLAGTTNTNSALLGLDGNAAQPDFGGGAEDGFVVRFAPTLMSIVQATYLGGSGNVDQPLGIAHSAVTGDLYVVGGTQSSDFPRLAGGALAKLPDTDLSQLAFVARLSGNLRSHLQSSMVGGMDSFSTGTVVAVNTTGDVYVGGTTQSEFVAGAGSGAQPEHDPAGNLTDGFVTRFDWALKTIQRSTYFGGNNTESLSALLLHPTTGEVYIAGRTFSDNLARTAGSVQAARLGSSDGYIARFSGELSHLARATYFGGSVDDDINAIAISPVSGELYAAGWTTSTDLAGLTNAAQPTKFTNGTAQEEGMIVRLSADLSSADTTPAAFAFAPKPGVAPASQQTSNPVLITGIGGSANLYITGSPTSAYCISTSNSCACEPTFGIFLPPEATTTISNNRYVCLRHTSSPVANQTTSTTLFVGAQAATFYVSTGSPFGGANCSLDVDGNGTVDAMTDGLLLLRAMLGLTGTAVTTNAVGGNTPSRPTWDLIRPYLNGNCGTSFLQ